MIQYTKEEEKIKENKNCGSYKLQKIHNTENTRIE